MHWKTVIRHNGTSHPGHIVTLRWDKDVSSTRHTCGIEIETLDVTQDGGGRYNTMLNQWDEQRRGKHSKRFEEVLNHWPCNNLWRGMRLIKSHSSTLSTVSLERDGESGRQLDTSGVY